MAEFTVESASEAEAEEVGPDIESEAWVPVTLEAVREEDDQARRDRVKMRNKRCELCEIADMSTGECSQHVKEVFQTEIDHARDMHSPQLWKAVRNKYNNTVLRRLQTNPRFKRQNFRRMTCAMVRRHYLDGHNRSTERMLWKEVDYIDLTLDRMKRGALWKRDMNSDHGIPVPNEK